MDRSCAPSTSRGMTYQGYRPSGVVRPTREASGLGGRLRGRGRGRPLAESSAGLRMAAVVPSRSTRLLRIRRRPAAVRAMVELPGLG